MRKLIRLIYPLWAGSELRSSRTQGTHLLPSCYLKGTVVIWDTGTGLSVMELAGHLDRVIGVVFSPDGKRLATGSADRSVKIWDVETGQELLTLYGHTGAVTDLAFSPDSRRLYTADTDGTVRVYMMDVDELLTLAQSWVFRTLTDEECRQYLHMEECP